MDEHCVQEHGFINCEKCDYTAEDKDLMKKHMTKHTGGRIFTCNYCVFEATKQSILEDHMETKHAKKEPWWQEDEPQTYQCDACETTFNHLFVKRQV